VTRCRPGAHRSLAGDDCEVLDDAADWRCPIDRRHLLSAAAVPWHGGRSAGAPGRGATAPTRARLGPSPSLRRRRRPVLDVAAVVPGHRGSGGWRCAADGRCTPRRVATNVTPGTPTRGRRRADWRCPPRPNSSPKGPRAAHPELGAAITADYRDDPRPRCRLEGGDGLCERPVREIALPVDIDSWRSPRMAAPPRLGVVRIVKDLDAQIEDREVLVVEDIVDSGSRSTTSAATSSEEPKNVECAPLGERGGSASSSTSLHRLHHPSSFVVGYGLDVDERYRTFLPCTGTRREDLTDADEEDMTVDTERCGAPCSRSSTHWRGHRA